MPTDILIVDDESDIRALIRGLLEDEGYTIREAGDSAQTFAQIDTSEPDLVILDIWLEGSDQDGLAILSRIRTETPDVPVLMISGHGTIEMAVTAIHQGAYDFIEKPFASDRLLLLIQRALETARLKRENAELRIRADGAAELVGESAALSSVRAILARVAPTNSRVLITGEPGSGKDVAARLLHRTSRRSDGPFVILNCAAMGPERFESALFGGGAGGPPGLLEQAHGGTLFLDEIADMPMETQARIVRVLQEQRFRRTGDGAEIESDARIVASSNRDLQAAMEQGQFRQDLFYRLNVVPVGMPPLREHPQDIPALADYFLDVLARQSGLVRGTFSQGAIAAMQAYEWPGNIRQLRNAVEWVMIQHGPNAGGEPFRADQLPPEIISLPRISGANDAVDPMTLPLREAREMFEKDYLLSQIARFGGNVSRTAQFVGMERSALHRKLKLLGVVAEDRQESRGN